MDSIKKNILFCIDSLQSGGAEIIMRNMVNELSKDPKLSITVQLLQRECELQLNDNVYIRKGLKNGRLYRQFIKWLPADVLHRLFIKGQYDYEIAFMEGPSTKIISGCRNPKTLKYAWIHTDLEKFQWYRWCYKSPEEEKKVYKKFDKVFAVSSGVSDIFKKRFQKEAFFVQNIILDKKIIALSKQDNNVYKDFKDTFNIVSVGTVKPVKGYERLIAVHRELKKKEINCRHFLIGDGPQLKRMKQLIIDEGLQDRIILKGHKDNPYPWIREADLLACVSYAEGYSSVVAEAIILGTPVLTTNCSGMRDILGDSEFGVIVENDVNAITEGLEKIIADTSYYSYYKKMAINRRAIFNTDLALSNLRRRLSL